MRVQFGERMMSDQWDALQGKLLESIKENDLTWQFDFMGMRFIDSAGLGSLVAMNGIISNHNGTLEVLMKSGSQLSKILNLTHLEKILQIVEV